MSRRVEQLAADERGQISNVKRAAGAAIGLIVGLTVLSLLAALLLPVGISGIVDDDSQTVTQDVGETVNVTQNLDATLDATDTSGSPDNATYTLSGPDSSATNTVDNGTSTDFSLDGGTVTVTVDDVETGSATATYSVPSDFGWSGGASAIWFILDVVIILGVFILALAIGLKATDRV